MAIVVITVENWSEYNPEKVVRAKKWTWFRFDISFFTHPDFADVPPAEKWVWPYILGECCRKKRGDNIKLNTHTMHSLLKISEQQVFWMLDWLVTAGMIKIISDSRGIANSDKTCAIPSQDLRNSVANSAQENRANSAQDLYENCDENARYITNITNTTLLPPQTPPTEGRRDLSNSPSTKRKPTRKDVDRAVVKTVALAVAGALRLATEEEIRKEIGETGIKILNKRFNSWDAFCACYKREWQSGYHERFKKDVERDLKAVMYHVLGITSPPDLVLVTVDACEEALSLAGRDEIRFDSEGSLWPN